MRDIPSNRAREKYLTRWYAETFSMSVPDGAQISLTGQVDFGVAHWAGPLFTLKGNNVTFNGNGNKFVVCHFVPKQKWQYLMTLMPI